MLQWLTPNCSYIHHQPTGKCQQRLQLHYAMKWLLLCFPKPGLSTKPTMAMLPTHILVILHVGKFAPMYLSDVLLGCYPRQAVHPVQSSEKYMYSLAVHWQVRYSIEAATNHATPTVPSFQPTPCGQQGNALSAFLPMYWSMWILVSHMSSCQESGSGPAEHTPSPCPT